MTPEQIIASWPEWKQKAVAAQFGFARKPSDDARATIEREAKPYDYGGAVDDIAPLDEDRPF